MEKSQYASNFPILLAIFLFGSHPPFSKGCIDVNLRLSGAQFL